jgi:lipid-binding SYLF domain-containing protein
VGTTAPSTWTRADSTGRYDLEFAASAARGTFAGLELEGGALGQEF